MLSRMWHCLSIFAMVLLGGACFAQNGDVPYNGESRPEHAKPGEVWCLVTIPAQYKTVFEKVMVEPASCRCETIPAVFETQTEEVCVKKESKRCIDIPAEYKCESYEVCVEPCKTEWKKVCCDEVKVSLDAKEKKGECYGLVTIPAKYETRTRQVCVKPASQTSEIIPAEFKTIEKRVCVKPESTRKIEIPAKFETTCKEICVAPERKVWRLTGCTLPNDKCNTCEEKKTCDPCNKCDPCEKCCPVFQDFMYDADYRDGLTQQIHHHGHDH